MASLYISPPRRRFILLLSLICIFIAGAAAKSSVYANTVGKLSTEEIEEQLQVV
jgi:hypothetical protein